jgi:hypothetical protein
MKEPYRYEIKVGITWLIKMETNTPPEDIEAEVRDTVASLLPERRWGEIAGEDIEIEVGQER